MAFKILFVAMLLAPGVEAKTSPVTKIVNMLKEMTTQLQKEQDQDNEMMETMNCWCETYDKEKTAAILAAEDSIASLKTTSEENGAAAALYTQQIAALEKQLAQAEEALASATEQRKKRLAEFTAEEKDLLASITSVGDAVIALEKHHSAAAASFIQESDAHAQMHSIAMTLKTLMRTHDKILAEVISPHQRKLVASLLHSGTSLVQSPEDYFAAVAAVGVRLPRSMQKFMPNKQLMQIDQVPGGKYYQSASGEIFGILKQMKESFEENLNSAQIEETADNKEFGELKAAKTSEIVATEASLDEKKGLLGTASFTKAKADQDAEDTQEILNADTNYLAMLKSTCATADADFEMRRKTRIEETEAVTKALEFLQSDEAQDLFHKTFSGASFVQKQSVNKLRATRAAGAAEVLTKAAHTLNRPKLAALAIKVRIDAFDKAKKQIQTMIDELTKEQKDEVEKKDMCIAELNSNEAATEASTRDKDEAIEKVEALMATIDKLAKEIADLKGEVAAAQTAFKRAGEDRELENKDFQLTIADQRATQKVLNAALSILKGFYDKAALLQSKGKQEPYVAGPPPPGAFKSYEKQGSGGVLGAIEGVIADSKAVEAEAITAESDAQQGYENFGKDTNDAIDEMTRSIITKTEFKSQCESDKVETEQSRDSAISTLEELADENAALHADCDYTLKNFDLRQGARGQEIEALKQAKMILSGASFSALLQGNSATPQM
jgi:hypothetical protein